MDDAIRHNTNADVPEAIIIRTGNFAPTRDEAL
jgi:hypothetical protein